MMLNAASVGMLGQEHYVHSCSPLMDVPTWFPCQSEGYRRTEEEQVSLAEGFLFQRDSSCLYERPAPVLIGVKAKRNQEEVSSDDLREQPPPSGDGSADASSGQAPPGASSTFTGTNLFQGSAMDIVGSMVIPT